MMAKSGGFSGLALNQGAVDICGMFFWPCGEGAVCHLACKWRSISSRNGAKITSKPDAEDKLIEKREN